MATGTWNQGELEKRVQKIGLNDFPSIQFRDTSLTSDQIFDIIEFPNRLTAGKNLIKIRASNNILVKKSKIYIEILDANGNPLYYEPLNYLEHDGTRVISIHVYPEKTAPGIGTIYLASRTKVDLNTNQQISYSNDYNDKNYLNVPNVLWSRNISIAPENSKNNTEIIFTRPYPKATVRERVNKFFKPVNLANVAINRNGTGTVIIKAIPSSTPPAISYSPAGSKGSTNYEGAAESKSPPSYAGTQAVILPRVTSFNTTNADASKNEQGQPVEVESAEIVTIPTFCRLETTGFALSSSMEGGSITLVNPFIEVQNNVLINAEGHVLPVSQAGGPDSLNFGSGGLVQLSGSYTFTINTLLSTTKANVFQTNGFKNEDENTYGAFAVTVNSFGIPNYDVKNIEATSNFTCSYIEPFVLSETEQSQSFAEIVLSNIEPATGDVFKIQTLYKPSGQFGDFVDAGYVNVEQVEIFEDITSYEAIQSIGMVYNRIGYFTSIGDFNKYWETSNGSITPEVTLTTAYKPDLLLDGIELTPDTSFDSTSNRFGYLHLKSEYHPRVYANTRYMLTLNAVADNSDSFSSSDLNSKYSRLDIYVSGSNSSIQTDSQYINRYLQSTIDIDNTLTDNLANNKKLGTRISTIELPPGISYDEVPLFISFKALKQENIDVYFVVRSGKWSLSNISLKSDKQTGFSPNYTRINTRIPSEFLETPLTFKFLYYDVHNNKAQAETTVYPVTFYGDNLVISGENNLLTGSVYIGNTTGAGIELAGVNSGFIRSIGYEGFLSASRPENPGGFMLYTGSVLPGAPDNYDGVGIEIVQDSSSFFKFDTNTGIDVRAKKFFVGTEDTQFVSGSTGNIEISSSNFHLKPDGGLIIGGDTVINADLSVNQLFVPSTATNHDDAKAYISQSGESRFVGDGAGNYIVDFSLTGAKISGFEISASEIKDSGNNLRLKSSGQITGSDVLFTGGEIGGFTLSSTTLSATNFTLDPGGKRITLGTGNDIFIADGDDGIQLGDSTFADAPFSVTKTGTLKATDGTIGGWTLASDRITGGSMIIRNNGTIESDGFVSNLDGSGFRLTAASGGFLEVENARIRGTLSTAVFEKETVNAVGGQLYVANSTTLTASIDNPAGSYTAADATMSVVNVSGFTYGEILSAKKINSTGFQTEYLKIDSSSRNEPDSETNFSGKIYVTRSYGAGTTGDSGSLGNTPGGAQSYTGSQVIVSTGKLGTGYIRLNANPNDQATPYIQIVERTGSGVYDLDLKAQLGDLSGVTDTINGIDVNGFGLYTDNAFLKGGIVATYGAIGGFGISSTTISSSNNNLILKDSGQITGSTVLFTGGKIGGFELSTDEIKSTNDNLRLKANGQVTASTILISGGRITDDVTIEGSLSANSIKTPATIAGAASTIANASSSIDAGGFARFTSASIGGFIVNNNSIATTGVEINNSTQDLFISSSNFKVSHIGNITASNALFSGYVEAQAMRQTTVTINSSNANEYLRHFNKSVPGGTVRCTDVYLNGELGGDQVSHIIFNISAFTDTSTGNGAGDSVNLSNLNAAGDAISGAQNATRALGSIRNIYPPTINSNGGRARITIDITNGKTVTMFIDKTSAIGMGATFSVLMANPTARTVSYG
tara:strand:+ start:474 stop:5348 length:4875 start_codon:yes stop_codon:yes gene_type:complete